MIILRYDEIGLKSRFVRRKFEDTLIGNIRRVLSREFGKKAERIRIKRDYGRIYIVEDYGERHTEKHGERFSKGLEPALEHRVAKRISRVFGIVGVDVAERLALDLEGNAVYIARKFEDRVKGKTFAVKVRRTGEHEFTSMDAAKVIGAKVKEITASPVRLKNPDVEIRVEIRDDYLYLIEKSFSGYGGLPTGTQERVISILSDDKSILSTWFALKRGCDVDLMAADSFSLEAFEFWAAYRKIGRIEVTEAKLGKMLEKAYELDYKGIYSSITAEELDSTVYETLLRRKKPVYMPLLPFTRDEIKSWLKLVLNEALAKG